MSNIPELAAHITTLCATHGITIKDRASGGGRSWAKTRTIQIKPVKSMITYFIGLHEVGHILHPRGSARSISRLEKEYSAWEWALENALIDPNDATKKMIHRCLSSYIDKAQRTRRMNVPPQSHPLWDMVREMGGD